MIILKVPVFFNNFGGAQLRHLGTRKIRHSSSDDVKDKQYESGG